LWGRQRWLSGNDWADARVPNELPETDSSLSLSHGECRQTCRGNRSSVMLKSKTLALGLAYSWGGGYGQQVCTSRICVPATANQKSTSPFCPAEGARLRVQHERILRLTYSALHSSSQGRLSPLAGQPHVNSVQFAHRKTSSRHRTKLWCRCWQLPFLGQSAKSGDVEVAG
jgi:hypothetical protein